MITAAILLVSRNHVSRVAAEWIGSSVLGTRVQIGAVYIGWEKTEVRELAIFEPKLSDAAQIEIKRIDIASSIVRGFVDGKWIHSVVLGQPKCHLRFDAYGNLLSEFPEPDKKSSDGGEVFIPLRSLIVSDAQLVIHQADSAATVVDKADLVCEFDDRFDIRGRVKQLLGGSVQFQTNVDAIQYAGTSILLVDDCKLDCESLPGKLLPREIRDQRVSLGVSLQAKVEHPAGVLDPRLHPLRLGIQMNDLRCGDLGTVVPQLTVAATTGTDGARVEMSGNPLDSDARLLATTDSMSLPVNVRVNSRLHDCDLNTILAYFAPDAEATANVGFWTQSRFRVTSDHVDFENQIGAKLSALSVQNAGINDVDFQTRCDGSLALHAENTDLISGLSGLIKGSVETQGVDLTRLAPIVGVPDLTGRISSSAKFEMPLDRLTDPNAARAEIDAAFEGVGGNGCRISDAQMTVTVSDGQARAATGDLHIMGVDDATLATLAGEARATLADQKLTLNGSLELPDARTLGKQLAINGDLIRGSVKAGFDASVGIQSAANPESWWAVVKLETQDLVIAGESPDDVVARCELHHGALTVEPTTLKWRENVCEVGLNGFVNEDLSVDGHLSAGPIRLQDLADVASRFSQQRLPLAGQATFSGDLHVDTKNADVTICGNAALVDATFAATQIGSADLDWQGDRDGFKIHTKSNDFLGGRYSLTATATELDWTKTTIESQFAEIKASRFPRLAQSELPVAGELSGGFKLTALGSLNDLSGHAWLKSNALAVQQVPILISSAEVNIGGGEASVVTTGDLLRGSFEAEGRTNLVQLIEFSKTEQPDLSQLPLVLEAKLRGLSISQAVTTLQLAETLRPLTGRIDATCIRDTNSIRDGLICTATASAESLRWNQATLTNRATAKVEVQTNVIRLTAIEGRLAEGRLAGHAELFIDGRPRGVFDVGVNRVNLRRATAPLGRTFNKVTGTASVRVSGRIGSDVTGRLDLSANNPSMADLNIQALRFPIDWKVSPSSKRVEWRCRSGVIDAGDGKIHISTEGSFDRSLNMRLAAKLNRIDTSRLLRGGSFGAGIVNGQVNLQAKRARDPKQIVGNFDITMSQVDSLKMPVLDQLDTLINLTPQLGAKQNDGGTLQGRLSGGLVHIDEMSISQSNVQVLMDGYASLDGRLKFDVTAATGQTGPADGLVGLANSPLMLAAPAPVALIMKANQAMKDRVVHVRIAGTASRPIVRLQPGKTLTQDTLRFFIANSFGSQVAGLTDRSQLQRRKR